MKDKAVPEWATEMALSAMDSPFPSDIERVARALVAAERRGIERAAEVALDYRIEPDVDHFGLADGFNRACVKIAAAIRNLGAAE